MGLAMTAFKLAIHVGSSPQAALYAASGSALVVAAKEAEEIVVGNEEVVVGIAKVVAGDEELVLNTISLEGPVFDGNVLEVIVVEIRSSWVEFGGGVVLLD